MRYSNTFDTYLIHVLILLISCPVPSLSTAQCTNCSNQVLLLLPFSRWQEMFINPSACFTMFFAAVLFYYIAVGTCSHRLLFIFSWCHKDFEKYIKVHMTTRWTIRHGLMLPWFTDLMNVTEEVTIHRPNDSTLLSSAFIRGDLNAATRGPFIWSLISGFFSDKV